MSSSSKSQRTPKIARCCQTCKVYGAYHDSRHCKIKQEVRPLPCVLNAPKSEPEELAPNPIFHPFQVKIENIPEALISKQPKMEEPHPGTDEDPAFWTEIASFCDSISGLWFSNSSLNRSITPPPVLIIPSCLLDDDPSFGVESLNTLMAWANHNPWEYELSQESHYTPFDDVQSR
ncbi:hypothetical protein L1987_08676 [Smallanthus sonchifolius]|uniref:Uncharacterized protein n=1 Tax=Smallanthus sonchifolius TaxID=185202 RepID=A0ACB9JLT8_9ASTR|nr:hypothetical protein L1987_08676 [Smallanthus sonchifolius]